MSEGEEGESSPDPHVLPVDARVFRVCARLMHRRPDHLFEDALIAATATVHHLVVVMPNVRHFTVFEVDILYRSQRSER